MLDKTKIFGYNYNRNGNEKPVWILKLMLMN